MLLYDAMEDGVRSRCFFLKMSDSENRVGLFRLGAVEDERQHDVADAGEDVELGLHVRVQGQVVV